jgi:phage tail-like protein
MPETASPLFTFRFDVAFFTTQLSGPGFDETPLGSGAFAECSGLEASMEPRTIKEGGNNDTPIQRAGPVSYATVVLKRGLTRSRDLWRAFEQTARGAYAQRLDCLITLNDAAGEPVMSWRLANALPVKFKAADFNARAGDIGVEELHLVHEGLYLV